MLNKQTKKAVGSWRVVREGLLEEAALRKNLKEERGSLVDLWGKRVPDRGNNSQCEGPKVRVCLVCGRDSVA